jgi:hypothetical protein
MTLTFSDALCTLEPHVNALYSIPLKAWDRYHDGISNDFRVVFCKRTRASAVHDLMLKEAAGYANDKDDVRWFESDKLYGLVIEERVAIRLKKLNSKKLPSNHRTKQVIDYRSQRHIDGIDAIHHLELGYTLDLLEKNIAKVYLVYPSGMQINVWEVELKRDKVLPVESIFSNREDDEIKPAIIKPRPLGIILPFSKVEREGSANVKNDNDKN